MLVPSTVTKARDCCCHARIQRRTCHTAAAYLGRYTETGELIVALCAARRRAGYLKTTSSSTTSASRAWLRGTYVE